MSPYFPSSPCAFMRVVCKYPDECEQAGRCLLVPQKKPDDAEEPEITDG